VGRMRACRSGWVAVVVACTVVVAASAADAAVKRCPRGQFDRDGECTSYKAAVRSILGITRSQMATQDAKAVIVRVDIGNRTLINRGLGVSMEGVPVSPKMNFRVGAMSIPFQTTIALQLQDEGRLDLDDKLARWFPQFPNADRVTLRMLASATSGYPDTIQENPAFQAAQLANVFYNWNDAELLRYAFALPPVCAPATCFHYAHSNFIVLGKVLEKVTHQSMTKLMRKRFLKPLGMRDTRMSKLPGMPQPVLHAYSSERGSYEDSTYWSPSWGIGRGVLMTSTARDMIKGIRAVGTGRFVSRSGLRQLLTPYSRGLAGAPPFDYGLGVLQDNTGWFFANPQVNGYIGILAYFPRRDISIVVENTNGPATAPGKSTSGAIFAELTKYLTPDHPLSR